MNGGWDWLELGIAVAMTWVSIMGVRQAVKYGKHKLLVAWSILFVVNIINAARAVW